MTIETWNNKNLLLDGWGNFWTPLLLDYRKLKKMKLKMAVYKGGQESERIFCK